MAVHQEVGAPAGTAELRLPRCECPDVAGEFQHLEILTQELNRHIGVIVERLKRWWDGDFGTTVGEDAARASQMQNFMAVALEKIPAAYLVRVFTHLSRGTLLQSCLGCVCGGDDKPLESARARGDEAQVTRIEDYLRVVREAATPNADLPLSFLEEWRDRLGNGWVDLILDDAAQHLRSHVGLLSKWQKDETKRKEDLSAFCESEIGRKYLEAREKYFPDGIPRNRNERLKIYSNKELVKWRTRLAVFEPAASQGELFENNPELVRLRDTHTEYERLVKPFTRPAWQPVSEEHPRWPFIPAKLFSGEPVREGEKFRVALVLPDFRADGTESRITIPLHETLRLKALRDRVRPWTFRGQDEITGQDTDVLIKGMRFERIGRQWKARMTCERVGQSRTEHEEEVLRAVKKRQPAPVKSGDVICVFSLEPRAESKGDKSRRAGFMRVIGMAKEGQKRILYSGPIQSFSHKQSGRQALRSGRAPYWDRQAKSVGNGKSTVHGPSKLVSFPQMLDLKRNIERETRLLRLIRDPERRDEAIERVEGKLTHLRKAKDPSTRRWERILEALYSGERPGGVLIEPLRERLKTLRQRLAGMKRNYRNSVAVEVLRTAHAVRTGNSFLPEADKFREANPNGTVFLVVEYHKGRGQGPLKGRTFNRSLAVLGPAEIYRLIAEKAEFMTPPIAAAAVSPKGIRKECPACGHSHAKNQSGAKFECRSCKHRDFVTSVAVKNLLAKFLG